MIVKQVEHTGRVAPTQKLSMLSTNPGRLSLTDVEQIAKDAERSRLDESYLVRWLRSNTPAD